MYINIRIILQINEYNSKTETKQNITILSFEFENIGLL